MPPNGKAKGSMSEIFDGIRRFVSWAILLSAWVVLDYSFCALPGAYGVRPTWTIIAPEQMTTYPMFIALPLSFLSPLYWCNTFELQRHPLRYFASGFTALGLVSAHFYFFFITPAIAFYRSKYRIPRFVTRLSPVLLLAWLGPLSNFIKQQDGSRV
jgi:hypothetical protein